MALVDIKKGKEVKESDSITSFMTPYSDTKEFFLRKLSEGIGMIASAFYPKPVIIRTSDFKSNEYKHMVGGERYEEDEMPRQSCRFPQSDSAQKNVLDQHSLS